MHDDLLPTPRHARRYFETKMQMNSSYGRQTIQKQSLVPMPLRALKGAQHTYPVLAGRFSVLKELWKLRRGRGRLSREEYFALRLFDNEVYNGIDKAEFVGLEAARRIWLESNYRIDLFALANNKIASAIWFAAHGLPILPTVAIFHEARGRTASRLLRSEVDLRAFLRCSDHFPLFGKPVEGNRSVGSASIECYVESHDSLITTAGRLISVDKFVSFVKEHAGTGYQFQSRIAPHSSIRDLCGERLATVRLLTIIANGKPEIFRACWKIPAGENAADNFWRPGNLLAQLDAENGRVVRVIRDNGSNFEEVSRHPDTGVLMLGMKVPNWDVVRSLAQDGAMLIDNLPLVGWDIAPVDDGAVLVEANVTPDFQLHQLADRRGVLDAQLESFLQERRMASASYHRTNAKSALSKWHRGTSLVREAFDILRLDSRAD